MSTATATRTPKSSAAVRARAAERAAAQRAARRAGKEDERKAESADEAIARHQDWMADAIEEATQHAGTARGEDAWSRAERHAAEIRRQEEIRDEHR